MTNSIAKPASRKPAKALPFWQHKHSGRWAKKVRGKIHYFGYVEDDPAGDKALETWLEQKDDLLAGRKPRPKGDAVTVGELVNRFLEFKDGLRASGEINSRTFAEYKETGKLICDKFGRGRVVDDLRPDDFQALRQTMAKRWGPVRLGNEIQRVRSVFKYGEDILDKPVRYGEQFRKPTAKVVRIARAKKGTLDYTADQLKALLAKASPNFKAMILLGINGGLGNVDCAQLTIDAVDLKTGWLNYPRPKTGIARQIPLWPETVAAIREALAARREPKDESHAELIFISPRGFSYSVSDRTYGLSAEFKRLLKAASVTGRTFYDLRRTFQTIAEGAHDLVAVQAIMGHAPRANDMSAVYRQWVDKARLQAVVDHVRGWLFG